MSNRGPSSEGQEREEATDGGEDGSAAESAGTDGISLRHKAQETAWIAFASANLGDLVVSV